MSRLFCKQITIEATLFKGVFCLYVWLPMIKTART